jgi:hypothetical protein
MKMISCVNCKKECSHDYYIVYWNSFFLCSDCYDRYVAIELDQQAHSKVCFFCEEKIPSEKVKGIRHWRLKLSGGITKYMRFHDECFKESGNYDVVFYLNGGS